jgi:hypothetical protein
VTEPSLDLQRALARCRERLGALAERLSRLSRLHRAAGAAPAATPGYAAGTPLPFGGADARPIDDLELTFRAVDADVDGGAGSDQDKAR